MSASATVNTLSKGIRFYEATIGKKMVMAVTGCIMFLFVIGHLIGNLQIYLPPGEDGVYPIDNYAVMLRSLGAGLWVIRGALLLTVVLHIIAATQLWLANRAARPQRYVKTDWVEASFASRNMIVTGLLLAAFIVYHLLHFTTGNAHPNFEHLKVQHNVVTGFQDPLAAIVYIAMMGFLGWHLSHGAWSMFKAWAGTIRATCRSSRKPGWR